MSLLTHPKQKLQDKSYRYQLPPNLHQDQHLFTICHDYTKPQPLNFTYHVYLKEFDYEEINWVEEQCLDYYLPSCGWNFGELCEMRINNLKIERDRRQFNDCDDPIPASNYCLSIIGNNINETCVIANIISRDINENLGSRKRSEVLGFALQDIGKGINQITYDNKKDDKESDVKERGIKRKPPSQPPRPPPHHNKIKERMLPPSYETPENSFTWSRLYTELRNERTFIDKYNGRTRHNPYYMQPPSSYDDITKQILRS